MSALHVTPNWPPPANVYALTTLRLHGNSLFPFDANNLSYAVGDDPRAVDLNRAQLFARLGLQQLEWLEQTHSNQCIEIEKDKHRNADAAITRVSNITLAIMTADCLPILITNRNGTEVAAIHAGWRGLVTGIVENTLSKLISPTSDLLAWIGPGICQQCFEVGNDVFDAFREKYLFSQEGFKQQNKKYSANLPFLAEKILNHLGVLDVYQANLCTFEQKRLFYSYRRTKQTGRMATLIGFTNVATKEALIY